MVAMSGGMEPCEECAHSCLLLHKRKNPSRARPLAASFFKVMVGDGFSKALSIPRTFAGKLASLIGKEIQLEDSTGRQWTVTLSNLDGDLYFQEGWHTFFLDHNIKFGDFLVFHYMMGLGHFVVQIYGKNGCEKFWYSEVGCVQSKRSKICSDFVTPNGLDNPLEKELVTEEWVQSKRPEYCEGLVAGNGYHKPFEKESVSNRLANGSHSSGSIVPRSHTHQEESLMVVAKGSNCDKNNTNSEIVCAADYSDEPYLMLNRDVSFIGQDNRIAAFDLSDFETSGRKCPPLQTNFVLEGNGCPVDDSLARAQTDASSNGSDPFIEKQENVADHVCDEIDREDEDEEMNVTMKDGNIGCSARPFLDSQNNNYSVDKALYRIVKESWKKHQSLKDMTIIPSSHALKHKEQVGTHSESTRNARVAERTRSHSKSFESLRNQKEHAPATKDTQQKTQQRKQGRLSDSSNSPLAAAEVLKMVKEEQTDWIQDQQICEKLPNSSEVDTIECSTPSTDTDAPQKVVEEQLVVCADFPSPLAVEIPCLVTTESESYLELSRSLPLSGVRGKPRQKEQVVILQDPSMRLWPVFYHEKRGLNVLTDGWPIFKQANGIQSGDTCCFAPQHESHGIWEVRIIRQ